MSVEGKKGSSYGVFSLSALRKVSTDAITSNVRWMHRNGQLCVKCQKESKPVKGCKIKIMPGLKLYICKTCVDAKKEAT